jgi:hypothetical protein
MTAGFVVALLEGFEGTLDAALEQIEEGELRREFEELRVQVGGQRQKFEEQEAMELMTSVP